ncbi:Pre-mRNA-processing factor 39 [Pteropus alecto]|uniref:Pre-mRNA-processing factor 39 n=1 Tax=Pteropus alecto TaxID=9402 RepID=L5JVS4_PTEAL|nr:Pre-mRNA-processing factor 39 [Pteropus alecto]
MQNYHMDEYRNSSNGSTGNSSEVVVEQSADFSTEIMNVTEMEQSPDGSPNVNATTEENEIANAVDLPVIETEANFPPEYEKFWKTVENNPQDFTGWVYLLQYVEQENHLMAARKAFDKFFIHYPYCYGYWKKYADLEKRHDNIKQSDEVRTSLNKVISIRCVKPLQFVKLCSASLCITLQLNK